MATTTAAAILYQRGLLDINAKVSSILGSSYSTQGKDEILIQHCLTHSAGYPGDPTPNYWDPSFGCPETKNFHPKQDFSCSERIYHGLLNQTLINKPGDVYLYSDLSFITLQYVVGTIAYQNKLVSRSDLLPQCQSYSVETNPGATYTCYFEGWVRQVFQMLKVSGGCLFV